MVKVWTRLLSVEHVGGFDRLTVLLARVDFLWVACFDHHLDAYCRQLCLVEYALYRIVWDPGLGMYVAVAETPSSVHRRW
jgi:hypothetical protein